MKRLKSLEDLLASGLLDATASGAIEDVAKRYAIGLTPIIAAQIVDSDKTGALRRQFLPSASELEARADERQDPIGDVTHSPMPGLIHRYPDRVLLTPTFICPVYCRFCFRRETVGPGKSPALTRASLKAAFAYIADRSEIFEAIVTGGDPLGLSPRRVGEIVTGLDAIAHLSVIRFHSRVPLVAPERIDEAMTAALASTDKTVVVALHANHPDEFTPQGIAALRKLRNASISLLGQTVLLKGVNDDATTLEALFRRFLAHGVKPYYLHHGDLAHGTAHFRTSIAQGLALMRGLRGRLTGLGLPTYVIDLPGGFGKTPLDSGCVREVAPGTYDIRDWQGRTHRYHDCL